MVGKLKFKKINGDFIAFDGCRTYVIYPPANSTAGKFSIILECGHPKDFECLGWHTTLTLSKQVCNKHNINL